MSHAVDATYENGSLKLEHPLPLENHQRVRVIVEVETEFPSIVEAQGLMGWKGDRETLLQIAEDPEFDPQERS